MFLVQTYLVMRLLVTSGSKLRKRSDSHRFNEAVPLRRAQKLVKFSPSERPKVGRGAAK